MEPITPTLPALVDDLPQTLQHHPWPLGHAVGLKVSRISSRFLPFRFLLHINRGEYHAAVVLLAALCTGGLPPRSIVVDLNIDYII